MLLALLALLGGCATRAPAPGPSTTPAPAPAPFPFDKDGPGANPPAELHKVPDAAPRLEPIRKGGPNKPYEVLGQRYQPVTEDKPLVERGLASWYGRKFHGRPTSSGEVYNMYAMTAAHPTMPIPSYARVRNPKNGREVIVRINDRGPFHSGRVIDLSYTAALKLDLLRGVAPVELERITFEDIRSGAWLRGREAPPGLPTDPQEPPPVFVASSASGAPERSTTQNTPPTQTTTAKPVDPAALLGEPAPAAAPASPSTAPAPVPLTQARIAPGFWLQLGAFAKLDGAEKLREQVARSAEAFSPLLTVVREASLHRLQAGPYASREQASAAAAQLRAAMALRGVVVERR
jgi:rare lipoprotein A